MIPSCWTEVEVGQQSIFERNGHFNACPRWSQVYLLGKWWSVSWCSRRWNWINQLLDTISSVAQDNCHLICFLTYRALELGSYVVALQAWSKSGVTACLEARILILRSSWVGCSPPLPVSPCTCSPVPQTLPTREGHIASSQANLHLPW